MRRPRLALTMGEPSGVGGETIVEACAALAGEMELVVFGDPDWLAAAAALRDVPFNPKATRTGGVEVDPIPLATTPTSGAPAEANAPAVIDAIVKATEAARDGRVDAVVTAPIVKSALYSAGFAHPGHTEFLAHLCGATEPPLMLLASEKAGLRVALVTIHLPLAQAVRSLSVERIFDAGLRLARGLRADYGVDAPRIAVAGLNPHAGEAGAIGREEIDIVAPATARLRDAGVDADGPAPADTLFHADARAKYDAVLCLYHDQGLIPLKTLDFYGGVNVTLGLPIVRTSPDHGAALDIAGTGRARPDSMIAAIRMAAAIAARRAAA